MRQFLILLLLTIGTQLIAQKGINFSQDSWKEVVKKADKADKLIFLDAYTTWCGPCKMMSNEVFPQKNVGKAFNTKFINVKMDMEKGEGLEIAKQYKVRAYPTLLWINGKGEEVHRVVGYQTPEQLIATARVANDSENNLAGLVRRYESGDKTPELLFKLTKAKQGAYAQDYADYAKKYLATTKNWDNPEGRELVFLLAMEGHGDEYYNYLLDNKGDFEKDMGTEQVNDVIGTAIMQKGMEANTYEEAAAIVKPQLQKAFSENAEKYLGKFKMSYYSQRRDIENFAFAAGEYYQQKENLMSANYNELNSIAWTFYEVVDNRELLTMATRWAERSVELEDGYFNNDTVAALYYKLGKKAKAKKAALHAIELAKENGEDASETEELLKKIEKL